MNALRRILRLMLTGGMIPAVLAAGLPYRACGCDAASSERVSCCCGSDGCVKEGGCPCCKTSQRDEAERRRADDKPRAAAADAKTGVDCRCGGPRPGPAAPTSSGSFAAPDVGLPAVASWQGVPLRRESLAAAERQRSARLPVADLPIEFCSLVI